MTIKVFGHRAPDTDAAGSALIWAWYLSEVRGTPAEAVLFGEPNTEAAFVLGHWSWDRPRIVEDVAPGDDCVVVDTNNAAELPPSINEANVIAVIDHHRLAGNLVTRSPIDVTIRPLACTATLMHELMGADAARMPERVRGLMLSCILSDTLAFRSPTTTPVDRRLAEELAEELGVDIAGLSAQMFAAKSDVSHFAAAELLRMDSKEYDTDGRGFRISVIETTSPATVLARKADLLAAMAVSAAEEGREVLLFVVDILREEATLLFASDFGRAVAERSFGIATQPDHVVLPGIMSRKKQIIPAIRV